MTPRAVLFLALVLLVSILSGEARAQTAGSLSLGANIIRRDGRPALDLKTINYDDCIAQDTLTFAVNVTGLGGGASYAMEVWTGNGSSSNCGDVSYRNNPANVPGNCWKVYSESVAMRGNITLKALDILPHGESGPNTGKAAICDELAATGASGVLPTSFIIVSGTETSASTTVQLRFDMGGPAAPEIASLGVGDGRLFATWKTGATAGDTKGYYLYCEPATGTCTGDQLVEGGVAVPSLRVGSASLTSTSAVASGLMNLTEYACAVAAYDSLNNVGKLSKLMCEVPRPVDGYFKSYREAGGEAGGGYCTFGRAPLNAGSAAVLAGLAAAFAARRRRRHQRSKSEA